MDWSMGFHSLPAGRILASCPSHDWISWITAFLCDPGQGLLSFWASVFPSVKWGEGPVAAFSRARVEMHWGKEEEEEEEESWREGVLRVSLQWQQQQLLVLWDWPDLMCVCVCVCVFVSHSIMSNSATPWTIALQAPLLMGFSRQENWSG